MAWTKTRMYGFKKTCPTRREVAATSYNDRKNLISIPGKDDRIDYHILYFQLPAHELHERKLILLLSDLRSFIFNRWGKNYNYGIIM